MHRSFTLALTLSTYMAVAPPALAQRAPDLATLDRGDGITKFGLDLGLTFLDRQPPPVPYDLALRFELHGQLVLSSGLGFYGAVPMSASFGDDDDPPGDQDDFAFGNADLGALYVLSGPSVSWVFRGGVGLPTADDDLDGILTNFNAVWPRLTDLALATSDAVYVRLSFSPLVHVNNLFLRADIGFDLGIDRDDLPGDQADDLLRLNIAAGIDLGAVALAAELVNLISFDNFEAFDDGDDDFLHTLAFSARFITETLEPFLAVGLPLDTFARDRVTLFISGGLQVPFQ